MKTLYYVAINTNAKMDADTYDEAAKALVKAFEALFLDADKVASVTMDHKKAPRAPATSLEAAEALGGALLHG